MDKIRADCRRGKTRRFCRGFFALDDRNSAVFPSRVPVTGDILSDYGGKPLFSSRQSQIPNPKIRNRKTLLPVFITFDRRVGIAFGQYDSAVLRLKNFSRCCKNPDDSRNNLAQRQDQPSDLQTERKKRRRKIMNKNQILLFAA